MLKPDAVRYGSAPLYASRRPQTSDQNTITLSAVRVAEANSSIVLRRAPSVRSSSPIPRASMQVPHRRTCSLPVVTRRSIRSIL